MLIEKLKEDKILKIFFVPGISLSLFLFILLGGYTFNSVETSILKIIGEGVYLTALIAISSVILIRLILIKLGRK